MEELGVKASFFWREHSIFVTPRHAATVDGDGHLPESTGIYATTGTQGLVTYASGSSPHIASAITFMATKR